jgi:hypothetical protein
MKSWYALMGSESKNTNTFLMDFIVPIWVGACCIAA